jgi:zinc transport system substrate-binding protein
MAAFTEAQLFLGIGFPFEERIAAKIADTNRRLVRVDTSATVPKRLMTEEHRHEDSGHEHEDSDEEHGEADPHVWLSPEAVRIQAAAIRDALKAADPAGAERYESNYLAFARELEDLDREIASILSGMEGKTVYVYHPVLGYFTDRYRLIQRAIEVEGKEPTARQLADFIDRLRAERVGMIFVQKEFSTRSAEAVAAETGAVVKTIDPLSRDWFQEMRRIAHDISGK